jgi:hypothetical protein
MAMLAPIAPTATRAMDLTADISVMLFKRKSGCVLVGYAEMFG